MHSTAMIALAVAIAAAPALAAPASIPAPASTPAPAASVPSASTLAPASGAFEITSDLINNIVQIGDGLISGAEGIKDLFTGSSNSNNKRATPSTAPQASTPDQSGAFDLGGFLGGLIDDIGKILRREDIELLARQVQTDESGAFEITPDLINNIVQIGDGLISGAQGIKDLFTGSSSNNKRATPSTAPQASTPDQSGAFDLGGFLGGLIDDIGKILRREDIELLARQVQTDESGALDLSSIFKIGGDIVDGIESILGGNNNNNNNQRRELHELFARAVAQAASTTPAASSANPTSTATAKIPFTTDASGAISLSDILSFAAPLIGLFARDDLELMAREPIVVLPGQTRPRLPDFTTNLNGFHPLVLSKAARSLNDLD